MVTFNKTPLGKTGCLGNLTFCLLVPIHLFILIQSVRISMVPATHCAALV